MPFFEIMVLILGCASLYIPYDLFVAGPRRDREWRARMEKRVQSIMRQR